MLTIKFLRNDGMSPYLATPYPLPTLKDDGTYEPGEPTEAITSLWHCRSGWHLSTSDGIAEWQSTQAYFAEPIGRTLRPLEGKIVAEQVRLLRPVPGWGSNVPQFDIFTCAADILEVALPLFPRSKRYIREMIAAMRGRDLARVRSLTGYQDSRFDRLSYRRMDALISLRNNVGEDAMATPAQAAIMAAWATRSASMIGRRWRSVIDETELAAVRPHLDRLVLSYLDPSSAIAQSAA